MSKGIRWEIYSFILSICISQYCRNSNEQGKTVVGGWEESKWGKQKGLKL